MSEIHPIGIDAEWLTGDELPLCLVQTSPPSMEVIRSDGPRQMNVDLLRHLLQGKSCVCQGNPILTELVPGGSPCLVMLPEYAYSSGEWQKLDEIIRSFSRPLLLIAGFGATTGNVLTGWVDSEPGTAPQLIEARGHIAMASRYNGAWCWIHQPGIATVCYCFLKTFPDESVERVEIPDLAFGSKQIVLEFRDLFVAPGICADLLCGRPNGWRDTLAQWILHAARDRSKHVLVSGVLFQLIPGHELWQNAIDNYLQINDVRSRSYPIVALVNHATSKADWDEKKDQWRSQSGIFASKFAFMNQAHLPNIRKVIDRRFFGTLIRRGEPCAVGGTVRWSKMPIEGRFLWDAGHCACVATSGIEFLPPEAAEGSAYECSRILKRLQLPTTRSNNEATAHLTNERDSLCQYFAGLTAAQRLVSSILHGLTSGDVIKIPNTKDLCSCLKETHRMDALHHGLIGLLFLHTCGVGEWSDEDFPGQIHGALAGGHVHTLVWCSPDMHGRQMMRDIQKWVGGLSQAPVLLVVGKPESGTLLRGRCIPETRSDITEADGSPLSRSGSWAEAHDIRIAFVLELGQVADCYPWLDEHGGDVRELIARTLVD